MRKLFHLVIILCIFAGLILFFQTITFKTNADIPHFSNNNLQDKTRDPVRKLLSEKGISFDPEILFSESWRENLPKALSKMRDFQTTLRTSNKLEGVRIADTVILPEKVELTGDVIIITNDLVLEGIDTVIEGFGKNIYVFPIRSTFHLGTTLENALIENGTPNKVVPDFDIPSDEKFHLPRKFEGSLTIKVNGAGYHDWLNLYEKAVKENGIANSSQMNECPPQVPTCNGGTVGEGIEGTPGYGRGIVPLPPHDGLDGRCDWRIPHGTDGFIGQDAIHPGPENAGTGGIGPTGDNAGTVEFNISGPPYLSQYRFEARGGMGGKGGRGGPGSPGDDAQAGGRGGDGQDCTCQQRGGGNGGDGQNGGMGGRGGRGGRGGPAGAGGNGGMILITAPQGFNKPINYLVDGGTPGYRGDGGIGGIPGRSGEGGRRGEALGNSNCPTSEIHSGLPGRTPPSYGDGEVGPQGDYGTVNGVAGNYHFSLILSPVAGGCNGPINTSQYPGSGCASGFVASGGVCTRSESFMSNCNINFGGYDFEACGCTGSCDPSVGGCSPVAVDVLGDGFAMTSAAGGVMFDLQGLGTPKQFSWIAAGSDDSWLALDRNNNGSIDNGRELFGNVTPQPPPPVGEEMNGFLALAEYDTAGFGGNGDGKINRLDAVFDRLRLWQDENHNGISESCELKALPEAGLRRIDLDYRPSRCTDEFGNRFKFKTKVRDARDAQLGRWAWDVFLVMQE